MRIDGECMEKTMRQFTLDYQLQKGEWITDRIHLSPLLLEQGARLHQAHDPFFKAAILMGKAYVMADEALHPWIREELVKTLPEWWCAFRNLRRLDGELHKYGREIYDTHIYFLPSEEPAEEKPRQNVRWFEDGELEQFREHPWFSKHALGFLKNQPDRLAVAACDGDELVGMAACSEDGAYLWQIGVDVLPGYEGRGLAANLVALLKQEIIRRGKVPFYGTSESHAISRNVAIRSGFLPAWAEIQVGKETCEPKSEKI